MSVLQDAVEDGHGCLFFPKGWVVQGQVADVSLVLPTGRVLVHCAMGISRSATLVLAFLMIYENMTLVEAIQTVQAHRNICPNSGFLRQLQVLDNRLGRETGRL